MAIVALCVPLALAGCSDDDTPATVQDELADEIADEFGQVSGMEVDEACIDDATASLSDADAQAILDNLRNDSPALTAAQQSVVDGLSTCLSEG